MHPRIRALSLTLLLLPIGVSACAPGEGDREGAQADDASIRQGIDETNRAAEQAVAAGDVAGFVERVYTEDGTILPPGARRISGRADIEAFWSSAADQLGLSAISLHTEQVAPMGLDMAYEIGTGTLQTSRGATQAKYVVIWKRGDDGLWRWHVDIWNEAAPAAPL